KVITALIENQAQAYFVCPPTRDSNPYPGGMASSKPRAPLDRLAKVTGAQAFYLKTADESASIAAKIIGSLRRQYEITYVSTNNKQDDKLRKVSVVVRPKDGHKLNVITRQGYYGPGHKSAAGQDEAKKKK